jgi:hypothetical protein
VDAVVGRLQAKWKVKYITEEYVASNVSDFSDKIDNANRNMEEWRLLECYAMRLS